MNEQYYVREGMTQYTGKPRVMRTGNGAYVIAGTDYGYLHTREGFVRTWRTYSGARRFLLAHFTPNCERANVMVSPCNGPRVTLEYPSGESVSVCEWHGSIIEAGF